MPVWGDFAAIADGGKDGPFYAGAVGCGGAGGAGGSYYINSANADFHCKRIIYNTIKDNGTSTDGCGKCLSKNSLGISDAISSSDSLNSFELVFSSLIFESFAAING